MKIRSRRYVGGRGSIFKAYRGLKMLLDPAIEGNPYTRERMSIYRSHTNRVVFTRTYSLTN